MVRNYANKYIFAVDFKCQTRNIYQRSAVRYKHQMKDSTQLLLMCLFFFISGSAHSRVESALNGSVVFVDSRREEVVFAADSSPVIPEVDGA